MSAFITGLCIIFRKEWHDALRDKRSLRMAFLPPLYFVAVFTAMVFFIIHMKDQASGTSSEPITLSVMGAGHLPPLIDWLEEQGVKVNVVGDDAYTQVEQKKLDMALIIPQEAAQQFAVGEAAVLWLVYDVTNNNIQGSANYIRQQVWGWNSRMGSLRLLARGISPAITNPVYLREMNIASDEKMGFFVMASLPFFLIISVFIGSVGFSADMSAGERERRSLESLLITPASSLAIIVGKWLTSVVLTFTVLLVELVLLAIAFAYIPFNQLGLRVDVSPGDLLAIYVALGSLILVAVALQLSIAIFARSFKDAQTYMAVIIFIPMLPMIYTSINPAAFAPWFMWVPVLGHQIVVKDLLVGGSLSPMVLGQFWLVGCAISASLLWFTARQLRKPNIVYGT